ncbi:polysaccharide deacetylase family protein [Vulcanisaeta distributa]|uniref:polysaccharide deacetylase family protein n=1 Tax=Vulcanisaeta distributa TaxID=164451 RepID=UPI001FB3403E|nr:polysaccharide deacetylase family protein [Vulcanisaeta distributa]
MYHEIERNVYYDIGLSKQYFENQLQYLLKLGFRIMPLCEALELIMSNKGIDKVAVITFDDGYKGVYEHALPIMKKYGVNGTVYVSPPGLIENKIPNWASAITYALMKIKTPIELNASLGTLKINNEDEKTKAITTLINNIPKMNKDELMSMIKVLYNDYLGEDIHKLYYETMLTLDQIKELSEHGFEIGGHGYYHLGLPYLNDHELKNEIESSKDFISKYNNCSMSTFAYPFGLYDLRVINAVKDGGFRAAVTMKPYLNGISKVNLYELGRFTPYRYGLLHLSSFKYQVITER